MLLMKQANEQTALPKSSYMYVTMERVAVECLAAVKIGGLGLARSIDFP